MSITDKQTTHFDELRCERRHQEAPGGSDTRTPFQRDRDRILYSAAFRRLANVTQVVAAHEGHFVHNRLTHSLKVAQVARRLAERLIKTNDQELIGRIGLDPDVVETAALAHDLGHPPFGHIGEKTLCQCLEKEQIRDGYEGNAQSFRIVTRLETSRNRYRGLNLTRASLNAIMKYPWTRQIDEKHEHKWGVYSSDHEHFDWARKALTNQLDPGQRTIEAAIMDFADDVTYSIHDLDDFYRAGILPFDMLLNNNREREKFFEHCCQNLLKPQSKLRKSDIEQALNALIEICPEELKSPYRGTIREQGSQVLFISQLIGKFMRAFRLRLNQSDAALEIPLDVHLSVDILKQLMFFYVYSHPSLAAQQFGVKRMLTELFDIIFKAIKSESDISILSPRYQSLIRQELESNSVDETKLQLRLTADIISSFSENEAIDFYHCLTGVRIERMTRAVNR